jgi:hypothetical protein
MLSDSQLRNKVRSYFLVNALDNIDFVAKNAFLVAYNSEKDLGIIMPRADSCRDLIAFAANRNGLCLNISQSMLTKCLFDCLQTHHLRSYLSTFSIWGYISDPAGVFQSCKQS